MLNVNMMIVNNIQNQLKKENKKEVDLADEIGVSWQTISQIMNGASNINAAEKENKIQKRITEQLSLHI